MDMGLGNSAKARLSFVGSNRAGVGALLAARPIAVDVCTGRPVAGGAGAVPQATGLPRRVGRWAAAVSHYFGVDAMATQLGDDTNVFTQSSRLINRPLSMNRSTFAIVASLPSP